MKDNLLPLRHIIDAIDKIKRYAAGKTIDDLKDNDQLRDSVLMNLVVIGEEAARISGDFKTHHPDIPWHEMTGMRNIISHDYFSIKPEIVWQTIQQDLPHLREQIERLL